MKLFIVRHGESIPIGADDERPLSERGEKDMHHIAKFLAPHKHKVSKVLQSPKHRAQQTAKILLSSITVIDDVHTHHELNPNSPVEPIIREINASNKDILLVGHLPFVGKLLSTLITGSEDIDIVAFKAGCMVCLEKIEGQWMINWVLSPELFK